jgi:hypothetical protein
MASLLEESARDRGRCAGEGRAARPNRSRTVEGQEKGR